MALDLLPGANSVKESLELSFAETEGSCGQPLDLLYEDGVKTRCYLSTKRS